MTGFHRAVLRHSVLCRDPVGQGREILCRDIRVLCHDKVGQDSSVVIEHFDVATELVKVGQVCRDRASLCHNRVGQKRENFYLDIKF